MKKSEVKSDKNESKRNRYDFLEMLVLTLSAVIILFSFCVRQNIVDGGSMDTTLADGERLLISDLFYTPRRGDVVVFQSPAETGRPYPLVKRVVAVAGDTVRLESEGVYVNNELLTEDYVYTGDYYLPNYEYESSAFMKIGETYTVPEGKIVVFGDHRNNSADSRTFGFIDERCVLGHVILRLFPRFGIVR